MESTQTVYDRSASSWSRTGPLLLSDYSARPFLLERCEPVEGARVADLGCGEGYIARQLALRGAAHVEGLDISAGMIEQAVAAGTQEGRIRYQVASATGDWDLEEGSFDLVVAVFLFNYLTIEEMGGVMTRARRLLKEGGRFVFAVPHPSLAWLRPQTAPFYFEPGKHGYFSGRDQLFEGRIWRRDGVSVPVRSIHKNFSDYFRALKAAGFTSMPEVEELRVTEEHIVLDPEFFSPLRDLPLHVAFHLQR
jgi:SAM-dependent methyltransferase